MKSITLLLLLISLRVSVPPVQMIFIARSEGIKDETLLRAILKIETKDQNPLTVNWRELAHGILMIRPVMIADVNRIQKLKGRPERYTIVDALNKEKAIEIYWIIQEFYNPTNDLVKGAIVWNGKSEKNLYLQKVIAQL